MLKKNNILIRHSKSKIRIANFIKSNIKYEYSNECFCDVLIISGDKNISNVLITADIIWFSETMVRKIKELFYKKYCIKEENVVLSASHTHGSPNPDKSISYPNFSERFDTYLFNIIIKCFNRAFKKKK